MKTYVTEFIGTFFLVLTVGLMVIGGSPLAPLAIGASLMIMVYMGGHISGAHYNPAVSFALVLRGKLPAKEFVPYVVAQLLGAIAAAGFAYVLTGRTFAPAPAATASSMQALGVEIAYTFALALVVLLWARVRVHDRRRGVRRRPNLGRRVHPGGGHRSNGHQRAAGRRHVAEPMALPGRPAVGRGARRGRIRAAGGLAAAGRGG